MTPSLDTRRQRPAVTYPQATRTSRMPGLVRAAGASFLYCLGLIPLALGAVLAVLSGQPRAAASWWRWLRVRVLRAPCPQQAREPGFFAVLSHAVLSLLLGVGALVPLGIEVLFLLRGVLYGLVDRGPYTESWGGPSLAGAWLAHFLVAVPFAIAGLLALIGIAAVHQRLTAALYGGKRRFWLVPVVLVIGLAGTMFIFTWLRQLPQ